MNLAPPLKKNDNITLQIDNLGSEGQGIGRYNGFAVFVPYALPGEIVEAHIIKVAKNYAIGKLISITSTSPNRVEPQCSAFLKCGGCALQHLEYEEQLEFKRRQVADALERIGGFVGIHVEKTLGMPEPKRYRNKASFPFAETENGVELGFYAINSHRLIPVDDCMIQGKECMSAMRIVRIWANKYSIPAYDERTGNGILRNLMVRTTGLGEIMVTVVTSGELPHADDLVSMLREGVSDLKAVVHNINPQNTNVILGGQYKTIWGSGYVTEHICGLRFDVSAASFLQVNTAQTELLYQSVMKLLNIRQDETVLDIYCGIGTITLLAAKRAEKVIGIEEVSQAVEDAVRNARKNAIDNAMFICDSAEDVLPTLVAQGVSADCIILDPPRKGCHESVLRAITQSYAKRIAYVSCNPATLARDCKMLAAMGYEIKCVQPVDMFCETAHVETVVLLSKGEIDSKKVRVEFSLEDMDMSGFQKGATYEQIKAYVLEHTGLKVSSLYISQIKRKCGLDVGQNYNLSKKEDAKVPKCPPEKEAAIRDALKYFQMI